MGGEKIYNLDIKKIKSYLRNRYPYLMIDYANEVVPGVSACGYKNVTINEFFFQGHFPNVPVMPGMIQMESLLQMLSLTVLTLEVNRGKILRAVSANNIKLKKNVLPGYKLDISANLISFDGHKGVGNALGMIRDQEACRAEFEFVVC